MFDNLLSMVAYALVANLIGQMWFPTLIMGNASYTMMFFTVVGLMLGYFFPISSLFAGLLIAATVGYWFYKSRSVMSVV